MNENQYGDQGIPQVPQKMTYTEPRHATPSHHISVEPLNRGFVVRVGCQSFAISSKQELVKLFAAYVLDPVKVEADWMKEGKLPE